jgi:Putative DNA-binding domain
MSALNEVLSEFARVVVRGDEPSSGISARYRNYSSEVAIEVYRNNYRGNLHDALAGAYPVIEQIVGKDFFRLVTRHYIGAHASHSGNLHRYGAEMADFLATFEPARGLCYLPDVAALEWACHCAYFADDAAALDLGRLAQIPAEQYPDLRLRTHPACRVLHSDYPIAAIWHAHQPGADSDFHIDLSAGACNALVSRRDDVVLVGEVSDAEAAWLKSIQSGSSLGTATDRVLEMHSDFDLQSTLLRLLQLGALVDA